MPSTVEWYVSNRVILNVVSGAYTVEQIRQDSQDILNLMRSGSPPVHLIVDARELTNFPSIFRPLLVEIEKFRNESSMGWSIMLTHNPVLNFFGALASNMTKQPFRSVKTFDEVNEVLGRVDQSVKLLLPSNR